MFLIELQKCCFDLLSKWLIITLIDWVIALDVLFNSLVVKFAVRCVPCNFYFDISTIISKSEGIGDLLHTSVLERGDELLRDLASSRDTELLPPMIPAAQLAGQHSSLGLEDSIFPIVDICFLHLDLVQFSNHWGCRRQRTLPSKSEPTHSNSNLRCGSSSSSSSSQNSPRQRRNSQRQATIQPNRWVTWRHLRRLVTRSIGLIFTLQVSLNCIAIYP